MLVISFVFYITCPLQFSWVVLLLLPPATHSLHKWFFLVKTHIRPFLIVCILRKNLYRPSYCLYVVRSNISRLSLACQFWGVEAVEVGERREAEVGERQDWGERCGKKMVKGGRKALRGGTLTDSEILVELIEILVSGDPSSLPTTRSH